MAIERGRMSQRSQRSHGTSSSSSRDSKIHCEDCCRIFVTFMCTQVGVGGLVLSYAIVGSFAFMSIEGKPESLFANETSKIHNATLQTLWNYTEKLNVLDKSRWYVDADKALLTFQKDLVKVIKEGYDGRSTEDIWTFPAALMFCLSVFTMIGYGHMTPKTDWGKISTIVYAVFGIPLYIVYFMNMGKVFAKLFKFLYRMMYRCVNRRKFTADDDDLDDWVEPAIIVPSSACMWVMIMYMAVGTIMFAEWENWSYLNSCYFSFTSLAKIGIGDFVPGIGGTSGVTEDSQTKLIINFMYLLIGMGLIAMCYTLMKEEIVLKLKTMKHDCKEKFFFCGVKCGVCAEEHALPKVRLEPVRSRSVRKSVRRH